MNKVPYNITFGEMVDMSKNAHLGTQLAIIEQPKIVALTKDDILETLHALESNEKSQYLSMIRNPRSDGKPREMAVKAHERAQAIHNKMRGLLIDVTS